MEQRNEPQIAARLTISLIGEAVVMRAKEKSNDERGSMEGLWVLPDPVVGAVLWRIAVVRAIDPSAEKRPVGKAGHPDINAGMDHSFGMVVAT